jgi:hypothetical protein
VTKEGSCNLRHPYALGVVLKSPITAIGFGCRHTSERIHQRYYIRPVNLVLYKKLPCECAINVPEFVAVISIYNNTEKTLLKAVW